MQKIDVKALQGPRDWSGPTLGGFSEAAVKLRWIDSAFQWHRNDGPEVFLVVDGVVEMHVRRPNEHEAQCVRLSAGELVVIEPGEEHIAYPQGQARVLVVESA